MDEYDSYLDSLAGGRHLPLRLCNSTPLSFTGVLLLPSANAALPILEHQVGLFGSPDKLSDS